MRGRGFDLLDLAATSIELPAAHGPASRGRGRWSQGMSVNNDTVLGRADSRDEQAESDRELPGGVDTDRDGDLRPRIGMGSLASGHERTTGTPTASKRTPRTAAQIAARSKQALSRWRAWRRLVLHTG